MASQPEWWGHFSFWVMWKEEFQVNKFTLQYSYPEHFSLCFWQKGTNVQPVWMAYRLFFALYFIGTSFYMVLGADTEESKRKTFIFISNWTYILQTFSFVLAFAIVAEEYVKKRYTGANTTLKLKKFPWHYKMLWVCYNVSCTGSVIVSLVFWLFVHEVDKFPNHARSLILHGANTFCLIIDFVAASYPYQFLHFYIPISYCTIYALFSLIYQGSGGTGTHGQVPIYAILDWRYVDYAVLTFCLCCVIVTVTHFSLCLLGALKAWVRRTDVSDLN